ncbi:purine-nucleoside phosphorylase [Agilicoccus flavus]|uniref:purine-nucleoside phosphorylase n=1 Tax=Agilicoccus flavus TaxID=2775968 RepID=UPI001CF6A4DC|nr:purine-nucleoside phosphorylase [Agilicoccus flavus]
MSDNPYDLAEEAAARLRERLGLDRIDVALVLGSGWSSATEVLDPIASCELADLPGFSAPVVPGHGGRLIAVRTPGGRVAAIFTGRTHLYEGRGVDAVVHGVRTAAAAGASRIVLTNGCGGLDPNRPPGTVVLIADHLNLTGATPLRGARFVDLSEAYSRDLRDLARRVEPGLGEGVYVQFHGPQFETPAEVRMAGILGGDLVGMSTTLETIAAREAGMEVLGLSLVTNLAAGLSPVPLDHHDVQEAGQEAGPRLQRLVTGLLEVL